MRYTKIRTITANTLVTATPATIFTPNLFSNNRVGVSFRIWHGQAPLKLYVMPYDVTQQSAPSVSDILAYATIVITDDQEGVDFGSFKNIAYACASDDQVFVVVQEYI